MGSLYHSPGTGDRAPGSQLRASRKDTTNLRFLIRDSAIISTMTRQPPRPPTDYRAYHRKTERNLAIAIVLVLVGVGGALIAAIYGGGAAALG